MLRETCLLCAILSFTACTSKEPAKPVHKPGAIIGGFKLKPSGEIERELTPSEVENLRRRDNVKSR